jgi:plasmid stabilization system protein ParE
MRKLYERIRGLRETPHIGRPGRVEGTREILFSPLPCIAVYRVSDQTIEIWRIWHTSQSRTG